MDQPKARRPIWKRALLTLSAVAAFVLLFFIATQIAIQQIFRGIESSHATGLSAVAYSWDFSESRGLQISGISRSAALRIRTDSFDNSENSLRQIVASHKGSFEEFKTETQTGQGRSLAATLTVPAPELDIALSDLKSIGRVDRISESGEDSAVKLASLERHEAAAKENLERLQKLYGQKGSMQDSIALQKEVNGAKERLFESEKERSTVLSTMNQASVRVTLLEEYRVKLDFDLAGASLHLRNSLIEGLGGVISSMSVFAGAILQYGLPLFVWAAILFIPVRLTWRRFRRTSETPAIS
ncbi:MAG TPA: DUF4349 domain-containing protein [Candidatus Acidoferrum sp.]|jgi:hypothetical protein